MFNSMAESIDVFQDNEFYAHIWGSDVLNDVVDDACNYIQLPTFQYHALLAMMVQQNSTFKALFDYQ